MQVLPFYNSFGPSCLEFPGEDNDLLEKKYKKLHNHL